MAIKKRKILLISYHYPPDAAVGAIRPSIFAKYLQEYGWEPLVLSVNTRYYQILDRDNGLNRGNTLVFRTVKIPTIKDAYMSLKKAYLKNILSISLAETQKKWTPHHTSISSNETIIAKLHRYINSLFIWLPDDMIGWVLPATVAGISLIRKHRPDIIMTTSPPNSVSLVGLLLNMITGLPWVADFRDPWNIHAKLPIARSSLSEYLEKRMQNLVLEKSTFITCVTPEMTSELFLSNRESGNEKYATIRNGVDFEELAPFISTEKYTKFTITYAGTFYVGRNPFSLLQATKELLQQGLLKEDQIQINFIGDCKYAEGISVDHLVKDLKLTNIVKIEDQLTRNKALSMMAASHVLLLLAPAQPLQVPAKTYEYIGMGPLILAECGNGATRNVLNEYPRAFIVEPSDLSCMKKAILEAYARRNENTSFLCKDFASQFNYRQLTGHLAEILDKVTTSRNYQQALIWK